MKVHDAKTKTSPSTYFFSAYISLLLAVLIIIHGLSLRTDVKSQAATVSSFEFRKCFDDEVTDHLVDPDLRMVLMVIDAWRLSFLTDTDSPMVFLRQSILSGRAVAFTTTSQTPTVTMPRIKALTSGVVPSLVSILGNFFASEGTEDSWVNSASSEGRRIAFFGDETWLRLFPNAFVEAEGVTSFFVNDFTEVDNNVTRHLNSLMKNRNWDMLILHYLGLDHIGHSLGGQSPQIKKKLVEMDEIVRRVFDTLSVQSAVLLVVVGDHGMTNAGSHGGGSETETQVPMLFLHSRVNVFRGATINDIQPAEQVDLASTLPYFLHTSIPSGSIGLSLVPQLARQWQLNNSTMFMAALQSAAQFWKFSDDSSLLPLIDVREEERCRLAKTFLAHAKSSVTVDEDRRTQRKIIQAQEQILRWPVFIGLALVIVSFILLSHYHGTIVFERFNPWSTHPEDSSFDLIDYSAYFLFFLYHLSSYSTSYIEEEHDIWYYITLTMILYKTVNDAKSSMKSKSLFETLYSDSRRFLLLGLHRLAMSFTSHMRRRWSMRADVLPPPIFSEFRFNVQFLDNVATDINLSALAKRVPFMTTLLCITYLLFRIRSKYTHHRNVMVLLLAIAAAICYQAVSINNSGSFVTCFIIGGVFITFFLSVPLAAMLYLSYLVRPETLPLLIITFEMGVLARRVSCSPYLLAFLCQTVFFYTGQSSNISTVDIAVGYKGLSSYIVSMVATQILINFYAMPISLSVGYFSDNTKQPSDYVVLRVLASILHLRSVMLFSAIVSMVCLSGHLFTFSVLAPKLVCEILHLIIALIVTSLTLILRGLAYGTKILSTILRTHHIEQSYIKQTENHKNH